MDPHDALYDVHRVHIALYAEVDAQCDKLAKVVSWMPTVVSMVNLVWPPTVASLSHWA